MRIDEALGGAVPEGDEAPVRHTVHATEVDLTRRSFLIGSAAAPAATEGGARPLTKTQERALRDAVRGRVFTPGDGGYNSARVVFNTRWDGRRPPAVVRVRDSADVRAVVRWADRYDIPLVSRSGGHGYNGNSTSDSAVVVDLRALNDIRVGDGTATIGPGAQTLAIYTALARRGVDDPGRLVPDGGARRPGPRRRDGPRRPRLRPHARPRDEHGRRDRRRRRRRVDEDDALFWALRGGGGSFAIVTAIRLRTRAVDSAAFFRITYPRGARAEALADWDAFAPTAPSALTAILTLDANGASAFGQYLGSERDLRRLIARLGGTPTTGSAPYLTVQRRWAGGETSPRSRFAASSLYVGERLSRRRPRAPSSTPPTARP